MQDGLFCSHFAVIGHCPSGDQWKKGRDDVADVAERFKSTMPCLIAVKDNAVGDRLNQFRKFKLTDRGAVAADVNVHGCKEGVEEVRGSPVSRKGVNLL